MRQSVLLFKLFWLHSACLCHAAKYFQENCRLVSLLSTFELLVKQMWQYYCQCRISLELYKNNGSSIISHNYPHNYLHNRSLNFLHSLKCHYDENRIFSIKAILKHKQVACMRRKMPFTIFKYLFLFQRYSSF